MDQLLPRKPQDVDRWSDDAERSSGADPATGAADPSTGPADRWANESARGEPDYPAPAPDDDAAGGVADRINADLEADGAAGDRSDDPLIHGQAR